MKTYRIIALVALATLAAGCGKESGRLRIFAETMSNGSAAKVWVNPTAPSESATWVAGELIDLNGTPYTITNDGLGHYIDADEDALPNNLYAIYPATMNADGNDLTVTNNGAAASTVLIRSLAVNFRDGGHDIVFPMATERVSKGSERLFFKHITGGLRLTLADNDASNHYTVGSVKVVVYGDGVAPSTLVAHNVTTQWEVQGPVLPSGEIGTSEDNQAVGFASEMHFTLKDNGSDGMAIPDGGSISFCVPVTVTPVERLVITGYNPDGTQLFVRSKELSPALTIMANNLYTIPVIEL